MNNKELELIGESIWNTYRDMALLFLAETGKPSVKKPGITQTGRGDGASKAVNVSRTMTPAQIEAKRRESERAGKTRSNEEPAWRK